MPISTRTCRLRVALWFVLHLVACATAAQGQSVDVMQNECSDVAKKFYGDFTASTKMQYNGKRSDGTHAINGTIYLETRAADFACSYNSSGRKMTEFYAEGRRHNGYLPEGNSGSGSGLDGAGSAVVRVTGIAANDVLNVRRGPGTGYPVIGALNNGDRVKKLHCGSSNGSIWCEIEMLTDMHERGWVNAQYLSEGAASVGGTAVQRPKKPSAGTEKVTVKRIRFPAGETGTQFTETLGAGSVRRYLLGAAKGQFLFFNFGSNSSTMTWRILNPDGTLLDRGSAKKAYQGQLWQSGDHVVEITNGGSQTRAYEVIIGIN